MESLIASKIQSWLAWFLKAILLLTFLILFTRLFELQVIKGAYFRSLSEGNRIRRINITAPRGKILARGGEILVDNRQVKVNIIFDKESGYKKVSVENDFGGELVHTEPLRYYPLGESFAHVSGYLGEVREAEVEKVRGECPEKGPRKLGDLVGRSGLEEEYDCILSGIDGEELIEVDALGNKIRSLGTKQPLAGSDLQTTIDFDLQMKVSTLLPDKKGGIVITDSRGQVLALYSSPSFNPNVFVAKKMADKISGIVNDKKNIPLFNRLITGVYSPGSIFKPVVALAALEEKIIDSNFIYEDQGKIVIKTLYGNFSYTNWFFNQYGAVEGKIKLDRALARSTDTFFYKLGELLGVDKLDDWSVKLGLDKETGIDLPSEIAGVIPSPDWKMRVKKEKWFLGNTYHMAIGQGDILVTPMAIHTAISAIASDGNLCQPYIAKEGKCKNLELESNNLSFVKEGMREACDQGGTGYTFFDFEEKRGLKVACKTGTAQIGEKEVTHAWFTAFAPLEKPEIMATVLVERGGEGSKVAGPIAREIFDYWFSKND